MGQRRSNIVFKVGLLHCNRGYVLAARRSAMINLTTARPKNNCWDEIIDWVSQLQTGAINERRDAAIETCMFAAFETHEQTISSSSVAASQSLNECDLVIG